MTREQLELAKKIHSRRSKRAKTIDELFAGKIPAYFETWLGNPGRYDLPGVDLGTRKRKGRKKSSGSIVEVKRVKSIKKSSKARKPRKRGEKEGRREQRSRAGKIRYKHLTSTIYMARITVPKSRDLIKLAEEDNIEEFKKRRTFIVLYGKTYPVREELKKMGFKFIKPRGLFKFFNLSSDIAMKFGYENISLAEMDIEKQLRTPFSRFRGSTKEFVLSRGVWVKEIKKGELEKIKKKIAELRKKVG